MNELSNIKLDVSKLTKPADTLIKKISGAIGILYEPIHVKRLAKAEAKAKEIRALAELETEHKYILKSAELKELQGRALTRFVNDETRKQINIENITEKSLEYLSEDSEPEKMNDDWIANFFDKCKYVSDDNMQILWAKILAGEANTTGKYTRRVLNVLSNLEKDDAVLFSYLLSFSWRIGSIVPIIYEENTDNNGNNYIYFRQLLHLEELGLISYNSNGIIRQKLDKCTLVTYFDRPINLVFQNEKDNTVNIGNVMFTKSGLELYEIIEKKPNENYFEGVLRLWQKIGIVSSTPIPEEYFNPVASI